MPTYPPVQEASLQAARQDCHNGAFDFKPPAQLTLPHLQGTAHELLLAVPASREATHLAAVVVLHYNKVPANTAVGHAVRLA